MFTPIFDNLRHSYRFMCQTCTNNGWPYGTFCCDGEQGLCD